METLITQLIAAGFALLPLVITFVARENFKLTGVEMIDRDGSPAWSCHFYSHSFLIH